MIGPTVYKQLLDMATRQPLDTLVEHVERSLAPVRESLAAEFGVALRHAYVDGVRDGFQQGVAAADDREGYDGIAHDMLELRAEKEQLRDALGKACAVAIWMSGSRSFAPGGEAHEGWLKERERLSSALAVLHRSDLAGRMKSQETGPAEGRRWENGTKEADAAPDAGGRVGGARPC